MMNWNRLVAWIGIAAAAFMASGAFAQQGTGSSDPLGDFNAAIRGPCDSFLAVVFRQECGGGLGVILPWLAFTVAALVGLALFRAQRNARQDRDALRKAAEEEITRLKASIGPGRRTSEPPTLSSEISLFNVSASLLATAIRCLEEGAADNERSAIIATLLDLRRLLEEELEARGTELPAVGLRSALLVLIDNERSAREPPLGVEAIWRLAAIDAVANRYGNSLGLSIASIAARSVFSAANLHVPSLRLLTPRAAVPGEWLWQSSLVEPDSDALTRMGRDAVRAAASVARAPDSLVVDVARFPILHGNVVARSGHFMLLGAMGA